MCVGGASRRMGKLKAQKQMSRAWSGWAWKTRQEKLKPGGKPLKLFLGDGRMKVVDI